MNQIACGDEAQRGSDKDPFKHPSLGKVDWMKNTVILLLQGRIKEHLK